MSICPDHELLSAYIDNEVPAEFSAMIAAHLENCAACRAAYNTYQSMETHIQQLGNEIPIPDFSSSFESLMLRRAAVINEKHELNTARSWFYTSVKVPVPLIAAAVTLFVLMPLFFFLKIESTLGAAQDSFKPIVPVSLEKQLQIPQLEFYVVTETPEDALIDYKLPPKEFIKNTKLFPVREFTQFYIKNPTFTAVNPAAQIKLPFPEFSLQPPAEISPEFKQKVIR
ncbi:MAG: anti-sigma factor family protein [Treponema sp.]